MLWQEVPWKEARVRATALTVRHGSGIRGLDLRETEGRRQQVGEGTGAGAVLSREEDEALRACELGDGLAAGTAGLRGGVVQVGDGDGEDTQGRAVPLDG